jgi:hypothetical protein
MALNYTEEEARAAIAASLTFTEALRRLGMCWSGGNYRTLKKWAERWSITTDHFDPNAVRRASLRRQHRVHLSDVLVRGSTYSRGSLKERLYDEGLKQRVCELCGQGEIWRGRRMSLILDRTNGVRDDHRLENLRIVCPNCAATLDTHCGRNVKKRAVRCATCGEEFEPGRRKRRYCSRRCASRSPASRAAHLASRRVARPSHETLLREIAASNWEAVGRAYGVSGNAIRKWVREYELASVEADRAAGLGVPGPVGVAGAEVDSAEPAVDRRAGAGAGEDGLAGGRELVGAVGVRDERVEVGGEGEDGGVAEPRRVLVLRYRDEEPPGRQWAVSQSLQDLAFDAREAGAHVRQFLQQALEAGDVEPGAWVG